MSSLLEIGNVKRFLACGLVGNTNRFVDMKGASDMNNNIKLIDNENFALTETGEIIKFEDIKRAKQKKIYDEYESMMSDLSDIGMHTDIKLIEFRKKTYNVVDIKSDFQFNKEFRVELRDIMRSGVLSKNARCFLGTITPFITFPSNSIIVDGKNPSIDELKDITDMGTNVMYKTLKELEDAKIINRVNVNTNFIIYINPFLYCGGYCVEADTYRMFKGTSYNPENR